MGIILNAILTLNVVKGKNLGGVGKKEKVQSTKDGVSLIGL